MSGSQCRSFKIGVVRSRLPVRVTSLDCVVLYSLQAFIQCTSDIVQDSITIVKSSCCQGMDRCLASDTNSSVLMNFHKCSVRRLLTNIKRVRRWLVVFQHLFIEVRPRQQWCSTGLFENEPCLEPMTYILQQIC